ncbi:polymerase delta-interacting protein 3-like isoform X2 [Paramormyrops kingsleyae]|uniref:polymerase delta-interacting protein 3-like isoform X2 n=1 Tax=Paramormyrops kingsleyae TaxID=1676925 RepID=UPI003B97BC1E
MKFGLLRPPSPALPPFSRHKLFSLVRKKMADLSLDELIRRRGLNSKWTDSRPAFRRGGGAVGRTFDARQKIGVADVRQRIGGVRDAREKLAQKDARFRIKGRGAGGTMQDARQMINSRKQLQQSQSVTQLHSQSAQSHGNSVGANSHATLSGLASPQGLTNRVLGLEQGAGPKKVVDARDRLSLKRSVAVALPTVGSPLPIKITKTIQQKPVGMTSGVRINIPNRNTESPSSEDDLIPSKHSFLHTKPGAVSTPFSLSTPITKVVQNDSYTAPAPLVTPPRAAPALQGTRTAPAAVQPVSRTLVTGQGQQGGASGGAAAPPAAAQPAFSPLEGTKMTVNNLHPRVTEEDIVELFCVCGALKRARLLKVGIAEVVFVRKDDAINAYRKYNNRCLDGQPMRCNLHIQGNVITSDQPILLRLSDTPGGGGRKEGARASLSRSGRSNSSQPTPEVDPQTILKALFKSSPQVAPSSEAAGAQSATYRVKI